MLSTLIGAKGGGGGSFVQKSDTLRSNDVFEGLLGLCAGPIKGPINGMKSIRLNGTAIEGNNGEDNFKGFVALFADGDPLKFPQIVTLKLGSSGAPQTFNVTIGNPSTQPGSLNPGPWTSRTLTNSGAEAVGLRFAVQQLFRQDKKGVFENTLSLEIQMKPSASATWINPFVGNGNTRPAFNPVSGLGKDGVLRLLASASMYNASAPAAAGSVGATLQITGKTTSVYVKQVRIEVPNTGAYANTTWDVRVRLVEPESIDSDPNFEKRNVNWESMVAIYTAKLGEHEDWRATSWLQLYGPASDNFNGLPSVDGIYETKIVSVPAANVFNPTTRIYSGVTWDGSWAKSYTNDPAWILNDIISDSINGISALVPGAYLNKWDALELSKWCSEPVPNGSGGTHPRFSLNLLVNQAQKSDDLVRFMAGACGATSWDEGNGEWRCKVDKPETPAAIFTHENIEGEFSYAHTDVDTRFNDVTVTFLNEEFDFREDWLNVQANADITKFGRRPTRIVAVGCTNRQQALRWAIQRLRTNINEFRMVSFTTNRQGRLLERFNHILVADNSLNDISETDKRRTTGRIIENKGTSIVVRDPLRLEIGVAYQLRVTVPNPAYQPAPTAQPPEDWELPTTVITRQIINNAGQVGDVNEIFLSAPLPANTPENANVALDVSWLPALPRVYRVLDIDQNQDGERVSLSAIEIDTGKFAAAEAATDSNIQTLFSDDIPPPIAPPTGMLTLATFPGEFEIKRTLTANWQRPASPYFDKYRVETRFNYGPWQNRGHQRDDFYEIQQPQEGRYDIRVYAVARRGFESLPAAGYYDVPVLPPTYGFGQDNLLQPVEKQDVILEIGKITDEFGGLVSQGTLLSISTTAYNVFYTALLAYLAGLSPAWNNTGSTTVIARVQWNTVWQQFYDARQNLLNRMAEAATWDAVVGAAKPENNATVNGLGPNDLLDDTFSATYWNLAPTASRLRRGATGGFAAGYANWTLDWNIPATAIGQFTTNTNPRQNDVTPGQMYYFTAWVSKNAAASNTALAVGVEFFDAAGAVVNPGFRRDFNSSDLVAGAAPRAYAVGGAAPTGAVKARVYLYVAPMASPSGTIRFERPVFSNQEPGADVTSIIEGPGSGVFKYSYTGVAEAGELPRDFNFSLRNAFGYVADNVVWSYSVADGQVNGGSQGPTSYTMATPAVTISTLESDTATILVSAVRNGTVRTRSLVVSRQYAAPPSSGSTTPPPAGGTGGTTTAGGSQQSSFPPYSPASPPAIAWPLTVAVTGTSATVSVNLAVKASKAGGAGTWNNWLTVQRETTPGSGVWVSVGAEQGPQGTVVDFADTGTSYTTPTTFTFSRQLTGLSAGNHNFRVVARENGTRLHTVTGTVSTATP